MNKSPLRLTVLILLTATALAVTLGILALLTLAWLDGVPAPSQRYTLATVAVLLVSGGISTLLGAQLIAAWRTRRSPTPSPATPVAGSSRARRISRRDFLKFATIEVALGGATVAAVGYPTRIESHWLQVEKVEVPIAGLPPQLDGLRIVQLSDLHLSAVAPLKYIQRAVTRAQNLAGDLVVVTGDYITDDADQAVACASALALLHAPLGVYAILGNHDHWTDAHKVAGALAGAGLTVLRNQGRAIARDGGERADLWLAGLDDVWVQQDDLESALRGAPAGVPVLLLVHEPDYAERIADRAAELGVVLQLSGHSHGGQVRLPLLGAPFLPYLGQKYAAGLQKAGEMWVYTNRGIGLVHPAVRFNCPPEITSLTLRRD